MDTTSSVLFLSDFWFAVFRRLEPADVLRVKQVNKSLGDHASDYIASREFGETMAGRARDYLRRLVADQHSSCSLQNATRRDRRMEEAVNNAEARLLGGCTADPRGMLERFLWPMAIETCGAWEDAIYAIYWCARKKSLNDRVLLSLFSRDAPAALDRFALERGWTSVGLGVSPNIEAAFAAGLAGGMPLSEGLAFGGVQVTSRSDREVFFAAALAAAREKVPSRGGRAVINRVNAFHLAVSRRGRDKFADADAVWLDQAGMLDSSRSVLSFLREFRCSDE